MRDPQADFGMGVGVLAALMLLAGTGGLATQFGPLVAVGGIAVVLAVGLVASVFGSGLIVLAMGVLATAVHVAEVVVRSVAGAVRGLLGRG